MSNRTGFVLVLALVMVTVAVPTALADATVNPDLDPPPTPEGMPSVVYILPWLFAYGGEVAAWGEAEAGELAADAFEVGECTLQNVYEDCPYVVVVDEHGDIRYVSASTSPAKTGVWQESNGCAGLQRTAQDCDGDASAEPADQRLV